MANSEEPWLNTVLDHLPRPFFLIDFNLHQIIYANAAAREIMGVDYTNQPAGWSYLSIFQLYDTKGTLVSKNDLPSARVFRGERVDEEYKFVSLTGTYNVKITSEIIPQTKTTPLSALIIFEDITSLKKIETDLRRAQEDLKQAVKIAQVGFWSLDIATNKSTISPQLMEQFGINPEDYTDVLEDAVKAIHPEDQERVTLAIKESIQNKTPYHIEYRVVHRDGTIKWIEAKSGKYFGESYDPNRFTGTTLDITERVKARQIREASEHELQRLADSMPQIVWSANKEGEIDYFNKVWFNYSGSTFEDNEGFGWFKYVHPEDRQPTVEKWRKAILKKLPFEADFRLRNTDGDYRWHVSRALPIFDSSNNVERWYGSSTDIHDKKLFASKLEEAWATAERANSAKSQFLANMSHEIRTPLGAIMGFAELIKDHNLSQKDHDKYLSVIERNSNQLLHIVDDILDLSKVEAGMMSMEYIEFSLPDILSEFTSLMAHKAQEKGIAFVCKTTTDLPSKVICDPTRLRQILMNILGNAIKFTDSGKVELRVSYYDDCLEFEIEDTGRGISPEHANRLFQPFAQADSSMTRKYGGTGLGLVLTRNLAEALGGSFILKESVPNQGSTFVVNVRALASENATYFKGLGSDGIQTRNVVDQNQLKDVKVLLVEDAPDNQALISIYLNRAGAKVTIAPNGEQGVKMANEDDYNIVLMDIQMPIMDGFSAVRKLRKSNYEKPIIALTAHAMNEERDRCLKAGFSDFLSKPVAREDLIKVILTNLKISENYFSK